MERLIFAVRSPLLFVLAGLCEIGGGYLFWMWLPEGENFWLAIVGVFVLALYGVLPTLQTVNFGWAYAAYGGIFIVLAILWGWLVGWSVGRLVDGWSIALPQINLTCLVLGLLF